MKNTFGLISRLDTAEERVSELEDVIIETPKTEKQRKDWKEMNRISKNCGTTTKIIHKMGILEEEKGRDDLKQ